MERRRLNPKRSVLNLLIPLLAPKSHRIQARLYLTLAPPSTSPPIVQTLLNFEKSVPEPSRESLEHLSAPLESEKYIFVSQRATCLYCVRASRLLDCVYIDLTGLHVKSDNGNSYVINLINNNSSMIWSLPFSLKSSAIKA